MKRWKENLGGVLFILLLLGIGLQTFLPLIWLPSLHGATFDAKAPEFTVDACLSGELTKDIDAWVDENFGFRSILIRSNRQISLSLFGDVRENNNGIFLGENYWLFGESYVAAHIRDGHFSHDPQSAQDFANKLKKLKEYCNSKGTDFFLIIAPSKTEIFPEYLPHSLQNRDQAQTDYRVLQPLLEENIVIDGHEWFLKKKQERVPYHLFSRAGTHWTQKAAFEFLKYTTSKVNENKFVYLPTPRSTEDEHDRNRGADQDLLLLLNIWDKKVGTNTLEYPIIKPLPEEESSSAIPIVVGDSFAWPFIKYMTDSKMVENVEMYYYFNSFHVFPGGDKLEFNKEEFALDDFIRAGDPIFILVNETGLWSQAWGFLDAAVSEIEQRSSSTSGDLSESADNPPKS